MQRKLIALIAALIVITGCSGVIAWINLLEPAGETEAPAAAPAVVALTGDAARGDELFHDGANGAPPCSDCHRVGAALGGIALGPNLSGLEDRADHRIMGMSATDYIAQSILEPSAYLVRGFRGSMYQKYGEHYDEQDIADLTAYLLSL